MKKIIKCCLVAVLSLVHFQSCAHEELFTEDQIALTEEIEKYVNEDAATKDPVFIFDPERWGIVQGRVSDEVALNNKDILNGIMAKLVDMGISTMEIGAMDAYFKVDVNKIGRKENSDGSIQIPSNFHLKMSDNTYLRVQPNSAATYTLMTSYLADNVTISGGHLIGDRWEHDYSPFTDAAGVKRDEHGWGHLLWIIGSENVLVENIDFSDAIGDGVVFHSETLRNKDGSLFPGTREVNNVIVRNVNIDKCRRNGVSILDGRNITFDNCNISNTGNGEQAYNSSGQKIYSSSGTAPRYGMDMEAIRTRDANGVLEKTALIENIIVKNSTYTNNAAGDIVLYTANDVVVENNYFDKWVANKASYNVIMRNNTFESRDPDFFAISVNSFVDPFGKELNYNYQILNNTIRNYQVGIKVAGEDQVVRNNIIENCVTGVSLIGNLKNAVFSGNKITSNLDVSFGYKNFYGAENINNLLISGEIINVNNRPVSFNKFLEGSSSNTAQITFSECQFNTANTNFSVLVKASKNIHFNNNKSNTGFLVVDSWNVELLNNLTFL